MQRSSVFDCRQLFVSPGRSVLSDLGTIALERQIDIVEVVLASLARLWNDQEMDGDSLIFQIPVCGNYPESHQTVLLDRLIDRKDQGETRRKGQLLEYTPLSPPEYASGIAQIPAVSSMLQADLVERASSSDKGILPGASYGWMRYTFDDWSGLSVHFLDRDLDSTVFVAIPLGRQDEMFAFLNLLDEAHRSIIQQKQRGSIEIRGNKEAFAEVIRRTSFSDVILPQGILDELENQRCIFDHTILGCYESLGIPRFRKVLLYGPPGTGKTSILKAFASRHAAEGGYAIYVCSPGKHGRFSPWEHLYSALESAAESKLPTVIIVEDFEMFVSDRDELQVVLNTLDGVTTPDNPSGTLLLATCNDPERIDPRILEREGRVDARIKIDVVNDEKLVVLFLKRFLGTAYQTSIETVVPQLIGYPGSHFRELCLASAMRAVRQGHTYVSPEDILSAHTTILDGHEAVADPNACTPGKKQRGSFFSSRRKIGA